MEPEDLPWPAELEEEEEEEPENLDEDDVVMVEEMEEEEGPELGPNFNYEFQRRESTDEEVDEEDDEARAWLQAPPIRALPPPPPPRRHYPEGERACPEERTESWHCLPQEVDSSHTLITSQRRFNVREEGSEVTDVPSVEEGSLTHSENQVKEHNRDFLCSPLLVIQDSFASPDLPLLTCLTQDQEIGPDSLFHQSELHFEPLRGIPDRSEDTEWLSRPSEVNEALFQAASEVVSDLVNSCFSVSHHPLIIGSTDAGLQPSFLPPEQGNKEETILSHKAAQLKPPKDSDSNDTLCSHVSRKTQEVIEQPETNLAIKDQVSFSTSSNISNKESDSLETSCSYVQCWEQDTFQQSEICLTGKDRDSFSDSYDTVDKNKISKGRSTFGAPCLYMPWRKHGASHHPETCLTSKDHVLFPHEIASHFHNKVSNFFLPSLLERRGKGVPLSPDSHYNESVDLRATPENEVKQKMDSLEDYKRNEDIPGKELSQHFQQKETRNNLVSLDVHPRASEIQHIGNVVVSDNTIKVSEAPILSRRHDPSKMEASGGILQTVPSNLGAISEQLNFQEEKGQKETSAFGAVVDATENVAFEAVIASIEPFKRENTLNEIQTDSSTSLTNASQESEPKVPCLSPSNYNNEKCFFDQLSHPRYQSTPGIFEPAASELWLNKKDVDDSSLYWHSNLKSPPALQELLLKPFSVISELKSSAYLSEKSHNHQAVGLSRTQPPLFQCDRKNESFLPIEKIKSDPGFDLAEKVGSSSIYPPKVATSDSSLVQDLKQPTSEEISDSSNCILLKHVDSDNIIEGQSAAVRSSSLVNLLACDEKSQSTSPSTSDASLPKAGIGQGEIPQGIEASSHITIHRNMQKDSCFVECLQGKAKSDVITPDADTECYTVDKHVAVRSERIAELLIREVGGSNLDINQTFSSVLPPFVPHEPSREPDYHSSDLRMLRIFLETVPETLKHLGGHIFKGGIAESTQTNLKTGTTANSEDSDFESEISLPIEALPQLAVRYLQEKTIGPHTDNFHQQPLLDSHLNEEALKVSTVPGTSGHKTGIPIEPPDFYGSTLSTLYQQVLPNSHLTEEDLKVSAVPEPPDQKTGIPAESSSSFSHREKPSTLYQQDSHQTEVTLKCSTVHISAEPKTGISTVPSSSTVHREEPHLFYQQELPENHLTEEAAKVSAVSGPTDQKIELPTVIAASCSQREKPNIFYQQELPDSHLTEIALKHSTVPEPADQKTGISRISGIPTILCSSCSPRKMPHIFYQQELSESHLTEVTMKSSALSGPANQKTGMPSGPPCSYPHRKKPTVLYGQVLPDSHPTEEDLKVFPVSGATDQKTGTSTIPCSSCSPRETPTILYQQLLPDSPVVEVGLKSLAVPGPANQKTGMSTGLPAFYSQRETPIILYQQLLPDNCLTEVALKSSTVSGPANQKAETSTVPSGSYTHTEKPTILYQQVLPDHHLTEEDLKVSPVAGPSDQKTGMPRGPIGSYLLREKPTVLHQQKLTDSYLGEVALKSSAVPGPANLKTGMLTGVPSSYSQREKPPILNQQVLPDSHPTEEHLKIFPVPGPTDQKSGTPTIPSSSCSPRETPTVLDQQLLPDSHVSEVGLRSVAVPGPTDQKTGMSIGLPALYSQREKPIILFQQMLPDIHLTEVAKESSTVSDPADQKAGIQIVPSGFYAHTEKPTILCQQHWPDSLLSADALKSSSVPGSTDQKIGMPTIPTCPYTHTQKPSIICQQGLPDSHLSEEVIKISSAPGPADQKTRIPTEPPGSYLHREKPNVFYQQELLDIPLTEEALKSSAFPEPADQKTRTPTLPPGSYSQREKPSLFYQQVFPVGQITEVALKSLVVPRPADQKAGTPKVPPGSYTHQEIPIILHQQVLPEDHLTEEALNSTALLGPADQKTGTPTILPGSYSHREKPILHYHQVLPEDHLAEESLKVIALPGSADQKAMTPVIPPDSYSHREKPVLLYQQVLPEDHLTEESLKVIALPGSADQKAVTPTVPPDSYSHREKPTLLYQKVLAEDHLTEESLKMIAFPESADQKTGTPSVPPVSFVHREEHCVFYQQTFTNSDVTEDALKVSAVPEQSDQKTEIPTIQPSSYSHRDKPTIFYQQVLPDSDLTKEELKVLDVHGPTEQKTHMPTVPPDSYSHREKPTIFYQQLSPDSHLTGLILKSSSVPDPADLMTGIPAVLPGSCSHKEKVNIFYQQELPDSHLTEVILKSSTAPGPTDQKTKIPTLPLGSYSHRPKPIILYQQVLPDSHLPPVAMKSLTLPGPTDEKTGTSILLPDSYSQSEAPSILYQQALPGSHLTEESLKVPTVPGPGDQKSGLPSVPPISYSEREKPSIFYQQVLTDNHLTEEAVKVLSVSGPAEQKIGIPTVLSSYHQQALPDSHLTEVTLKSLTVPGPAKQKSGLSVVPSSSYSHRDEANILHQQTLPDSHLTEDSLKVSAVSGPVDQKSGKLTISPSSYSYQEKPNILHQQALPDSQLTEESLKVPAVPVSADQKTGILSVPLGSYPHREKPSVFYQQAFDDGHLTEEALKVLSVSGPTDQKTSSIPTILSSSYSHGEKPNVFYQTELPNDYLTDEDLKVLALPVPDDQKTRIPAVPPGVSSYYLQELPHSHSTEAVPKDLAVPDPADQKPETPTIPPNTSSYVDKPIIVHQQELPDSLITEEALKTSAGPGLADHNTGLLITPFESKEKLKISTVITPDDQRTGLPTAPPGSSSHREEAKVSSLIAPDEQKTPLLTIYSSSYPQRVKPRVSFQQKLPDRHQNEDILKVSTTVPEPADGNTEIPVSLSSSSSHREKSNIVDPQELPDRHLIENALKISAHLGPADQKTVLPKALPSSSHRENPSIFSQPDLPDSHVAEDAQKVSSVLGQAVLPTVSPGTYSHSETYKVVSERVQRLIDTLDSSKSSIISKNRPLNSQADGRITINKPESLGFGDFDSEETRAVDSSSKTLKEIQTLLMEAENIALKRCNVPAPLVPFRNACDISHIQSKKVVCFKEPSTTDESNGDTLKEQPFLEESPSNRCIQKAISTQTNAKCQRGIENWEFISSTTVRSPLQEAESKARTALEETLKQYETAKYVMRSEPEGYSRAIGNKIVFPMMTFRKSDSSSDTSDGNGSCSWESNFPESLGSVSDVLLNFFPDASPNTSMTGSREEEVVSESDDGGGSSVDSLAAHVKNLLECESSLNHAKQILRDAEEEECRVRTRAWNLKFNLAHECGYSISALNEDDRRKVEEIKAKLFGPGRTTDLSKGLQSPQEIGCKPEAVCSHIIIEGHEKGCFRTQTAEEPQLESHSCIFRSAEPPEMISARWSPSSWRARNINLSKSLDHNNSHFKVWNSLQLRSHSPFQNFTVDDFKISRDLRVPFHEKMDPWLSELVEPACVAPEEMDFHSSSQILPPEPVKKFTTSITFSSHRHSKCFSGSSVFKVGVTEGTGASVGVFNSHVTEEQNPLRDLKPRTSSPSSFKMLSHSPDKDQTLLAQSGRQNQKLPIDFEHSHQEEKLLEISDFKVNNSKPSPGANCSNVKEIQFSDNHTLISIGKPSSTQGVKEKTVTVTPHPSPIFLEQRELFEQSKAPHTDHHVRKHPCPLPQGQDYMASDLPSPIFLEQRELFEQSKAPHVDHHLKERPSPLPQGQDYMASDLPSPIFLEQRELFEQSRAPHVDHHLKEHPSPLPQGQDRVVEKDNQHILKSPISNLINVEAKFKNVVSQSAPNQCTLVTSASTPPQNRKILSCFHITLSPKSPSNLDSGTLDKRLHSLDPASKTRMNSEFDYGLQTVSSRSLEPTSKLLTIKPVAQDQELLGFLEPKSSLDIQVVQSSLPVRNSTVTQDLKNIPAQNSQIVTSRQIQVNFSDLEEYSSPEGTPVSADRPPEESKTLFSAFSGKLLSDAVTQITTESPEKTTFSSEIFINAEDRGHEIPGPFTRKVYRVPVKFASSSSVQQIALSHGTDAQPLLLPYKPSGGTEMYYVPQLRKIPQFLDAKSDTTVESSHSGSNDAIAPDFPAQVLGTRDDDLSDTVNIKHKEGIYSKRAVNKTTWSVVKKPFQKQTADATIQVSFTGNENLSGEKQIENIYNKTAVTKAVQPEDKESLQKDTAGYSDASAAEHSAQVEDTKIENLPVTKVIKEKEKMSSKRAVPKVAWPEEKESMKRDTAESRGHSEFENTAHSVFGSAQFYFHPPVLLPSDQDVSHESLGRGVFMRHSYLSPPYQNVDKAEKMDYTTIESPGINVNVGNKEAMHNTKSQTTRDHPKYNRQTNDPKRDYRVIPEPTTRRTTSLNELWNRYQERQKQQKPPEIRDKKELSLVERLDRLAKILQNPITHSLQASECTYDNSRGDRSVKEWSSRQQQHKNKLQKKKRFKSLDKCHKNIGFKKTKVLYPHQAGRSSHINIEQIKFDQYIVSKQPGFNYISNTSSDSRPSEDSELLTDTATNILSTTTSPGESDTLTQTDKEVLLPERSSSISTIDTARLVQAFGHERVCLSPRQIKLYSSITNQQRRCLEKRIKQSKKVNTGHFQMTSEHTRRKNIQVEEHMISSDSVSSSVSSFWSPSPTLSSKQNVHMLNKGIQAGNLEIVNGAKKHTRDVGMTFPTPSSSEARLEEDSDVNSSRSEGKNEEKKILTIYLRDKKLKKNKPNSYEGVSWFIPVENLKSGYKKENLLCGPGVSWFEPITNTKPWREPLREKNWQGQQMDSQGSLAGPGRDFDKVPLRPFVRASLQESLQFHRPDFIFRSGERIKRLKLIVQERKLQNVLQSERDALFNTAREWQGCQNPVHPPHVRGFLAGQKNRPVGKKEMIQRSKRIYEQLPEVQKKREEEKRRSEYKSNWLRAQLYKKKVTNRLLGRKVPWD
ncbi:centrosome-associated protein ALMS1 isoform X2 [Dasypus novemcinctus]|uniref:centrosome-associated protein ALMS1 isoform X2 n=1 Tax=Dasypus novemcinctus TaxID=9361 RepID=UPI00265ECFA7|nr:centrosome-associated protein ALMS1 isoform X2 [Dasypus novemcinctus]